MNCAAALLLAAFGLTSAEPPIAPHASFALEYAPQIATPTNFTLLDTSSNAAGKLYEVVLPAADAYAHATRLVSLEGEPAAVGEAYGELLGVDADTNYAIQILSRGGDAMVPVLDWLWRCSLRNHTSSDVLEELAGIGRGGAAVGVAALEAKLARMLTAAALPEDSWNVQRVLSAQAAAVGGLPGCKPPPLAALRAAVGALRRLEQREAGHEPPSRPWRGAGHCDFFAAWGVHTEAGRLLASRNLDIGGDTGLSERKLVTVYRLSGRVPYATFGFAGFAGALAGMNDAGVAVAEANLDNSAVSFAGQAWPLKLRDVLGRARDLNGARAAWHATGNTAAFNFLLASAGPNGGAGPAAAVLEAVSGPAGTFTAELLANDAAEAASNFSCVNGTVMDDVPCSWPGNGGTAVRVGAPLPEAVFRSNHALHPTVMATQEPLWSDTVSRYFMLRDGIAAAGAGRAAGGEPAMTAEAAVNLTSLLGIKGADYGSCERSNTGQLRPGDTAIVLSAVYDPSRKVAYVAWEDGRGEEWRPASCAAYQRLDFNRWF